MKEEKKEDETTNVISSASGTVTDQRDRQNGIPTQELFFLVLRFLQSSSLTRSAEVLFEELLSCSEDALPRSFDWQGRPRSLSLSSLAALHPHIEGHHLSLLLERLLHLSHEVAPPPLQVSTLLGTDDFSLVPASASSSSSSASSAASAPSSSPSSSSLSRLCPATLLCHAKLPLRRRQLPSISYVHAARQFQLQTLPSCFSSPSSTSSAFALHPSFLSIYSNSYKELKRMRGHVCAVYCVEFDRAGLRMFTGSDDHLVKVWSVVTGRLVHTLRGHTGDITDLSVDPENSYIASGSNDKIIRVWSLKDYSPVAVLCGHTDAVTTIAFSPLESSASPSSSSPSSFRSSCGLTQKEKEEKETQRSRGIVLLSTSLDGTARVWYVHESDELNTAIRRERQRQREQLSLGDSSSSAPSSSTSEVQPMDLLMEAQQQAQRHAEALIEARNEQAEQQQQGRDDNGGGSVTSITGSDGYVQPRCAVFRHPTPGSEILCSSFHRDCKQFATGCTDGFVRVWWIEPPSIAFHLSGHTNAVHCVLYSNAGDHLLSASWDGTARVWTCDDGSFVELHFQPPSSSSSSSSSSQQSQPQQPLADLPSTIATSEDDVMVIDTASSTREQQTQEQESNRRMLRPRRSRRGANNSSSASSSASSNTTPQQQQAVIFVTMALWSLDDRFVVTALSDFTIRIWNARTGELLHTLKDHSNYVYILDKHPNDPRLFLSAGYDGLVILWDMREGKPIKIHKNSNNQLYDGRFAQDGSHFAVSDHEGHLTLYGTGSRRRYAGVPLEQFFHTDYSPLLRDSNHWVIDQQTQLPPHLMPHPVLCTVNGTPYAQQPPEFTGVIHRVAVDVNEYEALREQPPPPRERQRVRYYRDEDIELISSNMPNDDLLEEARDPDFSAEDEDSEPGEFFFYDDDEDDSEYEQRPSRSRASTRTRTRRGRAPPQRRRPGRPSSRSSRENEEQEVEVELVDEEEEEEIVDIEEEEEEDEYEQATNQKQPVRRSTRKRKAKHYDMDSSSAEEAMQKEDEEDDEAMMTEAERMRRKEKREEERRLRREKRERMKEEQQQASSAKRRQRSPQIEDEEDKQEAREKQQPQQRTRKRLKPAVIRAWPKWLTQTCPDPHCFIPQIGDEVMYFREGHQAYREEFRFNCFTQEPIPSYLLAMKQSSSISSSSSSATLNLAAITTRADEEGDNTNAYTDGLNEMDGRRKKRHRRREAEPRVPPWVLFQDLRPEERCRILDIEYKLGVNGIYCELKLELLDHPLPSSSSSSSSSSSALRNHFFYVSYHPSHLPEFLVLKSTFDAAVQVRWTVGKWLKMYYSDQQEEQSTTSEPTRQQRKDKERATEEDDDGDDEGGKGWYRGIVMQNLASEDNHWECLQVKWGRKISREDEEKTDEEAQQEEAEQEFDSQAEVSAVSPWEVKEYSPAFAQKDEEEELELSEKEDEDSANTTKRRTSTRMMSLRERKRRSKGKEKVPSTTTDAGDNELRHRKLSPPSRSVVNRLLRTLEGMSDVEEAALFWEPVSLEDYPTYSQSVFCPVDLQLIQQRLLQRYYRSILPLEGDIKRLAENAERFNGSDSPVTTDAKALVQILFEALQTGMIEADINEDDEEEGAVKEEQGQKGKEKQDKGKTKIKNTFFFAASRPTKEEQTGEEEEKREQQEEQKELVGVRRSQRKRKVILFDEESEEEEGITSKTNKRKQQKQLSTQQKKKTKAIDEAPQEEAMTQRPTRKRKKPQRYSQQEEEEEEEEERPPQQRRSYNKKRRLLKMIDDGGDDFRDGEYYAEEEEDEGDENEEEAEQSGLVLRLRLNGATRSNNYNNAEAEEREEGNMNRRGRQTRRTSTRTNFFQLEQEEEEEEEPYEEEEEDYEEEEDENDEDFSE
ncbi:Bromodomain and WD repeat-containing protein 3 [Balamuthia mandrillaris]